MNEDIMSLLEYKMPSFSKGQKRIAAFITESCDQAAFMTASVLGKAVGVSESTVVRFASELGFEGYPQMQRALQNTVLTKLSAVDRSGFSANTAEDFLSVVHRSDSDRLRQTWESLHTDTFYDAAQRIADCHSVYLLGTVTDAPLAQFAGYYLRLMFLDVRIVTASQGYDFSEDLVDVQPGDAVIAFCFGECCQALVNAVSYCHSVGASVIGITNSALSAVCQYCDCSLVAKSEKISVVYSLVAPMSVVNALIAAVASKRENDIHGRLEKIQKIRSGNSVHSGKDGSL